ncbi:MAG: DUF3037 domain-containing protein [Chitinophagaceae bacterium]
MQGNHLFEYAVVRVVPRVEREEFLNTGVILYCRGKNFLQMMYTLDKKRLTDFCDKLDVAELKEHHIGFEQICSGSAEGGPIAQLDMASRFRWLTAKRSTVVQTSAVHPGFCDDPMEMLHRLHQQMVL